jgi:hypothetical protein
MRVPEITRLTPLDEALAAVDSPSAVADRRQRAQKWAEELEGRARGRMFEYASLAEMNSIREPFRTPFAGPHLHGKALEDAERKAGRAADAVVLHQCEIQLRARDVAAVYSDPDRMEAERVWLAYAGQVSAVARHQGNTEATFTAKFVALIAERRDAETSGDAADVRAIEARLNRLTGVPYPQLPEAAWGVADLLPEADRLIEMERLEQKYGPRNPSTNGAGAVPKTSRRRLTSRPLATAATR